MATDSQPRPRAGSQVLLDDVKFNKSHFLDRTDLNATKDAIDSSDTPLQLRCDCHGLVFPKNADLTHHLYKQYRCFKCEQPNCPSTGASRQAPCFETLGDKKRHYRDVHGINFEGSPLGRLYCPWQDCHRNRTGFGREKVLESHIKARHGGKRPDLLTQATSLSDRESKPDVAHNAEEDITYRPKRQPRSREGVKDEWAGYLKPLALSPKFVAREFEEWISQPQQHDQPLLPSKAIDYRDEQTDVREPSQRPGSGRGYEEIRMTENKKDRVFTKPRPSYSEQTKITQQNPEVSRDGYYEEDIGIREKKPERESPQFREDFAKSFRALPREGRVWTEITKDLVVREALIKSSYTFEEEDQFFYVMRELDYKDVRRLVHYSDSIRAERRHHVETYSIASPYNNTGKVKEDNRLFDEHNRNRKPRMIRKCKRCWELELRCTVDTTNLWPCNICLGLGEQCVPPTDEYHERIGKIDESSDPKGKDESILLTQSATSYNHAFLGLLNPPEETNAAMLNSQHRSPNIDTRSLTASSTNIERDIVDLNSTEDRQSLSAHIEPVMQLAFVDPTLKRSHTAMVFDEQEKLLYRPLNTPQSSSLSTDTQFNIENQEACPQTHVESEDRKALQTSHSGGGGEVFTIANSSRQTSPFSKSESRSVGSCDSAMSRLSLNEQPNVSSEKLITDLAARVLTRCIELSFQVQSTNTRTCNQSTETCEAGRSSQPLPEQNTTRPGSLKRQRPAGSIDNDGSQEDLNCIRKSKQKREEPKSVRLFACPYTKFDPERYSERNQSEKIYRKCSSHRLVDISRIKQHLERAHKRPDFYCGICFEDFQKRDQFHLHQRNQPPCTQQQARFEERMTDDQHQSIKSQRLQNTRQSWYKIFRLLFPGAPEPTSPYVSSCDPTTLQHFTEFFHIVGPEEMVRLVRERRDQENCLLDINVSLRTIIEETFEIVLPGYELGVGRQSAEATVEVQNAFEPGWLEISHEQADGADRPVEYQPNGNTDLDLSEFLTLSDAANMPNFPSQVNHEFGAFVNDIYDPGNF